MPRKRPKRGANTNAYVATWAIQSICCIT